jgi:hypothetical protein
MSSCKPNPLVGPRIFFSFLEESQQRKKGGRNRKEESLQTNCHPNQCGEDQPKEGIQRILWDSFQPGNQKFFALLGKVVGRKG